MTESRWLLTAEEVGELLQISPKTVLCYAREGRIPHRRLGRHVRFIPDEIQKWLNSDENRGVR